MRALRLAVSCHGVRSDFHSFFHRLSGLLPNADFAYFRRILPILGGIV